ncbi:Ca2-binding protein [Aureococcus anophagefferens]|nr:Ca2-binding protein [Aureococcus anophagefferens]
MGAATEAAGSGSLKVKCCELVHWCTRVDDEACVAVLELVACEVDPATGRTVAQYGCGWSYLRLFGPNGALRVDASDENPALLAQGGGAYETLPVYDGTPRRLVAAGAKLGVSRTRPRGDGGDDGDLALAAGASEIRGCGIVYRARRHDGLLRLATEHVLVLEELRVKVEDRGRLEQALLNYVGFQQTKTAAGGQTVEKREKIVGRRLAVGLHNGRALTLRRTEPTGFTYVDLDRADGDVLAAAEGARVVLPGYCKHALFAVVVVVALEYEVRPLQRVPVLSGGAAAPQTFRVCLGLQGYVPFDGKRLRLRTGRDAKYVEVALAVDDTCREVSSHFVWPPPPDGGSAAAAASRGDFDAATLQRFAGGKLVGFDLSATVADDEELGDDDDDPGSDSSADSTPRRKPRKRRPRKKAESSSESEPDSPPKSVVSGDSRRSRLFDDRDRRRRLRSADDDDDARRRTTPRGFWRDSGSGGRRSRHAADDEPPLILKYAVDTSASMPNEGRAFAEYLALKALYVDRSPVAKLAAEHAVVAPFGLVDEGSYGTMNENFATPASVGGRGGAAADAASAGVSGAVVGHVQIVCCNYGEEGKGSLTTKKADDERPLKDALGRSLDWRKASSNRGGSKDLATIYGGVDAARGGDDALRRSYDGGKKGPRRRPGHRVRARPLAESNPELGALLESRDRRGGLFAEARGRSARDGPAVSADSNAVTYDEVLMMVRRFRDDRGRVQYRGPLLSLLEAPNLKALEAQLIRVLTKAEAKGTTLERAFAYFDQDHGGTISVAIFLKAEELGVSVVDAFNEFDADGNGQLTVGEFGDALRSLGTFSDLKPRELEELFALMGRDYADHLVLKLSRILDGVERKGTMIADCFAAWDADGGGSLSRGELTRGLRSLGIFNHMKPRDVEKLLDKLDDDKSGDIDIKEFYLFAKRDYGAFVEARVRAVLRVAEAKHGVPLDAAFREWDKDGGRSISLDELRRGLDELGVFKGVDEGDIKKLLKKLDDDDSGEINMAEFLGFAGCDYSAVLARRLRAILLNAEERGTTLEAAFAEWDKDGGGTIDHAELKAGLKALGTFADMSGDGRDDQADVDKLVRYFDRDGDGSISVRELLRFMGRDPISSIEAKLRQILGASAAVGDAERLVLGALRAAVLKLRARPRAAARSRRAPAPREPRGRRRRRRSSARDVGVEGAVDAATRLLLGRFDAGGGASVGALVKFAKRGRGHADEIARDLGEPSASPTEASTRPPDAAAALEDPACAKLAELLLTFEASGADLAVAFKKLDPDGSGDIEAVELFEGLRGLGDAFADLTLADARRVVKALDADRSNSIDLTELRAFALAARNAKDEPDEDPKSPTGDGAQDKRQAERPELHKALKHVGGDDLFRDVTRKDVEALVRREFDDDGDAEVDIGEFVASRRSRSTTRRGRPAGAATALSVKELLRGLRKLGVFQELDADDVEKLVRSDLDRDGNDAVELDEFLAFCRDAPGTGGKVVDDEDADLEIVSRNYEFSLDPDTRCVEKKLRGPRASSRAAAATSACCWTSTTSRVGSVIRSDFVQVLMQLGLSSGRRRPPRGDVDDADARDALRERQLAQLAAAAGGPGERAAPAADAPVAGRRRRAPSSTSGTT